MVKSSVSCDSLRTKSSKMWPYEQYYLGEKDEEARKNGHGLNHWTGAESLESYSGRFVRNTMHGAGIYRWRHRGRHGAFFTYEGHFYVNRMHGYGTMSYPDGRVFVGLYDSNIRWGPGIESHACLREDVGLWRGSQLVRMAWRPPTSNVAVDLTFGINGRTCVEPHRVMLATVLKTVGEVNSALELLKQYGSEPISAAEKWSKLYPKHCTDLASQVCQVEVYEHDYYKGKVHTLEEFTDHPTKEGILDDCKRSNESFPEIGTYFAWNNNQMMVHMIKHCYKHEKQRSRCGIDLIKMMTGPRNCFKPAGKHELDCRTLLMASYLGHIIDVAQLINECGVHPDVADIQGNSAVMYATCGNQSEIIHFLVEAGAKVDSYNDSCCTPLGMALMKFACAQKDVSANGMTQALLPPPVIPPPPRKEDTISEWNLTRDLPLPSPSRTVTRTQSKTVKSVSAKKIKSLMSLKDISSNKKKTEAVIQKATETNDKDSLESFSEEKRLYHNIIHEYTIRVNDLFLIPSGVIPIPYIFEVNDMVKEIGANDEDQKKIQEKAPKKVLSKVLKDTMKPSKEMMWQGSEKDEYASMDSNEKNKIDTLARIMLTILQLLTDGANPRLVRCPQPALLIATVSGCSDLVHHLIHYGSDVNEVYPRTLNYTALDVAVSRPFSFKNLELIRTLLECGASPKHRLRYTNVEPQDSTVTDIPGPTLLHAVLARKSENDVEEEIRRQVVGLLLEYNCDALLQFKGRSAVDLAISKSMELFDIFVKCPYINLNAVINNANQNVLVKLFSLPFCNTVPSSERLQALTNLLLFGANPLLKCYDGEQEYQNLFVFTKKTLAEMENSQTKPSPLGGKPDSKAKKPDKPKKEERASIKSIGRLAVDDVGDYKQAMDLVTECARLLHIRWLQAKLMKELIEVVYKYKHRHWNMILKEHKNKKCTGLWITASRCLEIWNILKTTKKKVYSDNRVLKHLLCIIHYYNTRPKINFRSPYITGQEKGFVESDVSHILYEYNIASPMTTEIAPLKRHYVTPELDVKAADKFNVCFECALPFEEQKIVCTFCKLISFCSFECMKTNIDRTNCHPCSNYLKEKYFPSPDDSTLSPNASI